MPLARTLGVKAYQLPLDRLASALDRRIRRAGDNEVRNVVLRGGEGPSYRTVLARFGTRHQMEPLLDPEQAEQAILRWWMGRFWDRMEDDIRERIWGLMELGSPPPSDLETALQTIDREDPHGYLVSRPGVEMLALGAVPGGGCLAMLWLAQTRDDLLLPAVLEVARLRQSVRHRVTVGVVGSPAGGGPTGWPLRHLPGNLCLAPARPGAAPRTYDGHK